MFERVYFIAAGDITVDGTPVKIGYSGDPTGRLIDLQGAHHAELELVATTPPAPSTPTSDAPDATTKTTEGQ